MRKIRGFTLIECLVCIAILGILGGIIGPAVIAAKEKADAKKTPPRFEFSEDIAPEGFYAYLVKDTLTKKQFLVVSKNGGTVTMDVTPTVLERGE